MTILYFSSVLWILIPKIPFKCIYLRICSSIFLSFSNYFLYDRTFWFWVLSANRDFSQGSILRVLAQCMQKYFGHFLKMILELSTLTGKTVCPEVCNCSLFLFWEIWNTKLNLFCCFLGWWKMHILQFKFSNSKFISWHKILFIFSLKLR